MEDKELEEILSSLKAERLTDNMQTPTPKKVSSPPYRPAPKSSLDRQRREKSRKKAKRRKKIQSAVVIGLAVVALILAVFLISHIFKSDDALKGTWSYDEVTVYEFDGKGAGVMHTALNDYAFTYKTKNSTLTIDFESDAAKDSSYVYAVSGNTLTLESGDTTFELKQE